MIKDHVQKRESLNQQLAKLQKECREMAHKEKEGQKIKDQMQLNSLETQNVRNQL